VRAEQQELGNRMRALLAAKGLPQRGRARLRGARRGGQLHRRRRPPVGKKFLGEGLQTAAGVPLQCDEPADFKTFRIGLFGLDKLHNVESTVANLDHALSRILGDSAAARAA
jgi:aspartate aminotransferase-like enzyme